MLLAHSIIAPPFFRHLRPYSSLNRYFNMTMHFRKDSDIRLFSGRMSKSSRELDPDKEFG